MEVGLLRKGRARLHGLAEVLPEAVPGGKVYRTDGLDRQAFAAVRQARLEHLVPHHLRVVHVLINPSEVPKPQACTR